MFSKENKKFVKTMFLLAFPIMLQEFIFSTVGFLDILMIGHKWSGLNAVNAINGVGLANQISFLFFLLTYGFTSGASIFMGQYWGQRDTKNIHRIMGFCLTATFSVSLVLSALVWIFAPNLIDIYTNEEEVIKLGTEYLRLVVLSFSLSTITVTFNSALRSIGQTKVPMATSAIALVFNAFANAFFIFGMKLGVSGAALGTIFARIAELVSLFIIIYKYKMPIATKIRNYFKYDFAMIKNYFKVSVPVIANEFTWALGISIYSVAYQFCGNEAQSAVQISGQIQNLFIVVGIGIGSACAIMISNQLGAGESKLAIKTSRKFLIASVVTSVVMASLLILSSRFIVSLNDTNDMVKDLAVKCIYVCALGIIIKTYNYTGIIGILRSGGDTRFCLILDVVAVWCIGIPLAFIGAKLLGLPIYIVLIMVLSEEILKVIVTTIRILKNGWAKCLV